MTTLDALIAACLAEPNEDTPRLAYLDALEERDGESDFITATREFYAKCKEPRRFSTSPNDFGLPVSLMGKPIVMSRRRVIPGWRDWLSVPGDTTFRVDGKPMQADNFPVFAVFGMDRVADVMNWHRLVPSLWSLLKGDDKWRRVGSRVTVQRRIGQHSYHEGAVRLDFARGWLLCAEFRSNRWADEMGPALQTDQPFCIFRVRDRSVTVIQDRTGVGELLVDP